MRNKQDKKLNIYDLVNKKKAYKNEGNYLDEDENGKACPYFEGICRRKGINLVKEMGFLYDNEQDNFKISRIISFVINTLIIKPIYNQNFQQSHSMTTNNTIKNYYAILGVPENASLFEIQNAYQKLAAKYHPDKHKEHRKSAQAKFHEVSEAFQVLSDRNKRVHYDQLLSKQYSLQDAHQTFDRFFNQHGILDEQQEQFFNTHYPNPLNNYYKILGVSKNTTFDDIKKAYRKLSIKYHPKNNPNDQFAHNKFIEVNEAFNALSDQFRRQNYDNIVFGQIAPYRAHSIFDDFFGNRFLAIDDEDLKPVLYKKWSRNLDKMMLDQQDQKNIKQGETIKTSSVYSNKNGKEQKKTVTTKKNIKDGKVHEQITEQYLFPNGDRNIVKKNITDGKVQEKKYNIKKGEQLPKELTN